MTDKIDRNTGLGGTDISAILGMNPFRGPWDVYALKCGLVETDSAAGPRAEWGTRLQKLIAEKYAEETGLRVEWCDRSHRHPLRPWQIWTPDAFAYSAQSGPGEAGTIRGLDCKTAGLDQKWHWGDSGSDEVPDYYSIQAQWYMSASGLAFWDIALLLAGSDFRIYTIEADKDIQETLLEEGEKFWAQHVLAKNPPDLGASELAKQYLRKRFPRNVTLVRQIEEDELDLIVTYAAVREEHAEKKALKDALENQIKERIGHADGIQFTGGRVTWKKTRDSKEIDWEGIGRMYLLTLPREQQTKILDDFTSTKPGVRRFDFRLKG